MDPSPPLPSFSVDIRRCLIGVYRRPSQRRCCACKVSLRLNRRCCRLSRLRSSIREIPATRRGKASPIPLQSLLFSPHTPPIILSSSLTTPYAPHIFLEHPLDISDQYVIILLVLEPIPRHTTQPIHTIQPASLSLHIVPASAEGPESFDAAVRQTHGGPWASVEWLVEASVAHAGPRPKAPKSLRASHHVSEQRFMPSWLRFADFASHSEPPKALSPSMLITTISLRRMACRRDRQRRLNLCNLCNLRFHPFPSSSHISCSCNELRYVGFVL